MSAPTDGYFVYDSISWSLTRAQRQTRLATLKTAGLSGLIDYNALHVNTNVTDFTNYIADVNAAGLQIAIAMSDPKIWRDDAYAATFPVLYAASGVASSGQGLQFAEYVYGLVSGAAGIWGMYIGDEVAYPTDYTAWSSYADGLAAAYPSARSLAVGSAPYQYSCSRGNYPVAQHVTCAGDDWYHIGSHHPEYLAGSTYTPESLTTAIVAANIQSYCTSISKDSCIVLQAMSFANYGYAQPPLKPWPSNGQMVADRAAAIANMTPRLIIWYSYFDAISAGAPAQFWNSVSAAIQGLQTGAMLL